MNAATWNLAYRNRRMQRSVPHMLFEFVCSKTMANYTPSGSGSLATGQVGGTLSGCADAAAKTVDAAEPQCLSDGHTQSCPQDLQVTHAPNMRDAA